MNRDDLYAMISGLEAGLTQYRPRNQRKWDYYDGEAVIRNIGLAIPESMVNVDVVLGWPEIIVDALDERLDWLGWVGEGSEDLMSVFRRNQLQHEFDKAKIDSLVTGVGFLEVSAGNAGAGDPEVIVNSVSSMDATYQWDGRANKVSAGLVRKFGPEGESLMTLYLPDRTIAVTRADGEEDITEHIHNRGRAGLVPFPNRTRAGQVRGKSEITKAIRYYTDHGVRTLLGMEYNRELYTTPQRWFKNVYPEQLGFDENDSPGQTVAKGFKAAMNRVVAMEPNYNDDDSPGPEPQTGQYQSAPPTPYIEQLKMLSQLCSAQSGVPANYFGFHTQNPPSADAIRATESRLVKRAERRQSLHSQILRSDLAYVIQSILNGSPADGQVIGDLDVRWRDAATPTKAASVDAATKLVQARMVPEDSSVLLDMAGFTPDEQKRIEEERSRSVSRALIESIRDRRAGVEDPLVESLVNENRPPAGEEL